MKRSSSPPRGPRPEPTLAARAHPRVPQRPEPPPSPQGLPGRPWHALALTVPEARALPCPAGLGRRATDPLGRGWLARRRPQPAATATQRSSTPVPSPVPSSAPKPGRAQPRPSQRPASGAFTAPDAKPTTLSDAPAHGTASPAASRDPLAFLPPILFTGDLPVDPSVVPPATVRPQPAVEGLRVPGDAPLARTARAALSSGWVDDVWLQPRDPLAWVAHWSANAAERERMEQRLGRGRWWLRLRDPSRDGLVIAERPATENEGSVILPLALPGQPCVAELGYDAFHSGWHPVARAHAPGSPGRMEPSIPFADPGPAGDPAPMPGLATATATVAAAAAHPRQAAPAPETQRAWEAWHGHDAIDSAAWVEGGLAPRAPGPGAAGLPTGPHPGVAGAPPTSGALARPTAGPGPGAPFRFAVNVEVVIHGSTEPDARVLVGGRPVALRPDGSFSLRWVLPDGDFRVPAVAVSRDGRERREARLRLLRGTATDGGVGVHGLATGGADPITGWAG